MKKAIYLIFSMLLLASCSSDDNGSAAQQPDPGLLQKVIFYPGAPGETHLYFDNRGRLSKTTSANGALLKEFEYDSSGKLVHAEYFGSLPATFDFTYDASGRVASVNGDVYSFDGASGTYTRDFPDPAIGEEFDYFDRYEFNVDAESRLVSEFGKYLSSDGNYDSFGVGASYSANGNVESVWSSGGEVGTSYTYDGHANPLKAATESIRRAFAVTQFGSYYDKFITGRYASANNPITEHTAPEDPDQTGYTYVYNSNGLPKSANVQHFYFGELDNDILYAQFYYQGDVLP